MVIVSALLHFTSQSLEAFSHFFLQGSTSNFTHGSTIRCTHFSTQLWMPRHSTSQAIYSGPLQILVSMLSHAALQGESLHAASHTPCSPSSTSLERMRILQATSSID